MCLNHNKDKLIFVTGMKSNCLLKIPKIINNLLQSMETGELGQHGALAANPVDLALSHGAVCATTQHHQMGALTVLEVQ